MYWPPSAYAKSIKTFIISKLSNGSIGMSLCPADSNTSFAFITTFSVSPMTGKNSRFV